MLAYVKACFTRVFPFIPLVNWIIFVKLCLFKLISPFAHARLILSVAPYSGPNIIAFIDPSLLLVFSLVPSINSFLPWRFNNRFYSLPYNHLSWSVRTLISILTLILILLFLRLSNTHVDTYVRLPTRIVPVTSSVLHYFSFPHWALCAATLIKRRGDQKLRLFLNLFLSSLSTSCLLQHTSAHGQCSVRVSIFNLFYLCSTFFLICLLKLISSILFHICFPIQYFCNTSFSLYVSFLSIQFVLVVMIYFFLILIIIF